MRGYSILLKAASEGNGKAESEICLPVTAAIHGHGQVDTGELNVSVKYEIAVRLDLVLTRM